MPEFDGFIITVPVAARQIGTDPVSGTEKVTLEPIPERIDKLARLSIKWAKLKYIPNPESIPYYYHGYYRWIRDVFKADAIIHFGTHGTLEWLPGKSVGLSGSCFPDVGICDLPNIYPYIIHNPGEGTGAKRRIFACLVDYLPPVMHNADTYEDLASLDVQLKEYYRARSTDPGKIEIQKELIWKTITQANLDKDFNVTREDVFADFIPDGHQTGVGGIQRSCAEA